jgi:hypothetical protein
MIAGDVRYVRRQYDHARPRNVATIRELLLKREIILAGGKVAEKARAMRQEAAAAV